MEIEVKMKYLFYSQRAVMNINIYLDILSFTLWLPHSLVGA